MARRRIAVIGLGMAVKPHARSLLDLHEQVEVAGCYSPTQARRAAFAEAWGLPVTDDLDALLADPGLEAVMILTPPNTHLDLVRRAAEAGKHILLEKPLEISTDRAVELVRSVEAAGVTMGVVLQNRFRSGGLALEALRAEGRLGELVSATLQLRNWRPQSYYDEPGRGTLARDGGGVLLTQGVHPIDQLIAFAGLPSEVMAYAGTSAVHRMETEDVAAAALSFAGGAIGTLAASTCTYPGLPTEIEIVGTKGGARLVDSRLTAAFHNGTTMEAGRENAVGGQGADPMAFDHGHHRAVLADFLEAIETGRAPKISGRDALRAHFLIDAILASARSGRAETVAQDI